MTPAAFIARAVGIPWVKWRSDWSGCDCFGLLVLWHREVLGIDLGSVPQTDIAAGFGAATGWQECGPEAGATAWMSWRDGAPTHCGILLTDGRLLHCDGSEDVPGNVRVSRLEAIRRTRGEIRFYRFNAC